MQKDEILGAFAPKITSFYTTSTYSYAFIDAQVLGNTKLSVVNNKNFV
jgi:hypothetical protein